ncbi:MAG: threonine/serine exporter ThrE family protein [Lachnospirales bacterium]
MLGINNLNEEIKDLAFYANRDLTLAIAIGELMLKSGGETTRVENTISIILKSSNYCKESDVIVLTTGIFVTITDMANRSHTMLKRVNKIVTNLNRISELNELSRKFVSKELTYDEIDEKINFLETSLIYPIYFEGLFSGFTSAAFCYMIFLDIYNSIGAFFSALVVHTFALYVINRKIDSQFVQIIFASMLLVFGSVFVAIFIPNDDINRIIIGGIMPLVPGSEMVTGVRDIVEGNFLSATARLLNAILIGVGIAVGVGIGLSLWLFIGGTM